MSLVRLLQLCLVITLSLVRGSGQNRRKTTRTRVQHEEGSCYAPDFICPDWAPCCSKHGFCGYTADFCSRQNCLANCWKDRETSEEEDRRNRRRRQGSRTNASRRSQKGETIFVSKANYYSRKGYR